MERGEREEWSKRRSGRGMEEDRGEIGKGDYGV